MAKSQTSIWINGADGRMGQALLKQIAERKSEFELADKINDANVILDFSHPEGTATLLKLIKKNKLQRKSVLIGTTGLNEKMVQDWQKIAKENELNVLLAPNTSLGIYLLTKTVSKLAKVLSDSGFDIEISETHHREKIDSPSGTAKLIASEIFKSDPKFSLVTQRQGKRKPKEIGMQSFRGGSVVGEHTISFFGDSEELHFSHRALSRDLFAKGALILGQNLIKKPAGFYELMDLELGD